MKIDTAIASINDNQDLNCPLVRELFVDSFVDKGPDELDVEVFRDYLKIQKLDSDSRYNDIAPMLLEEIEQSDLDYYEAYLSELESEGIDFVPFYSDDYPARLWNLSDAPLCLYVDGDTGAIADGVAIAGTRQAHDHRLEFVHKIAQMLVERGEVVISGLANGVDEAAHESALDSGGRTVAILPGQVKKVRPSSNEELGERIRENGALVSEVSERKSIHRGRFVERNRITSGISSAIIIGASGDSGGTIHQADFAQEQEKPRFLYSPDEDDGQSPEKLFKKGFVPFSTISELEDLLDKEFIPPDVESEKPTELSEYF